VDDSNEAAWINYAVTEPSGQTNLDCAQGTFETWISGDFNSSDGLGAWGVILEAGNWNTNLAAAAGAWGIFISPDASNVFFSAQGNGIFTNFCTAPIAWNAGDWHHLAVTFDSTNTAIYLDGTTAGSGPGVTIIPSAEVLSNGFSIGSDGNGTGMLQARSVFNDIWIYNYPLDAATISNNYFYESQNVYPLPGDGGNFTMDSGPPSFPGGFNGGTNSPDGSTNSPAYAFDTNGLWIQALPLGTNAFNSDPNSLTLILNNTIADIAYQLLSTTNLNNPVWTVEQNLIGSEVTNFTVTTVSMIGRPTLFFKAIAFTLDSDGDGLPDWWETKYSTTSFPLSPTNADTGNTGIPDGYKQDSAGDGYNNLQKYQMGIPPGTWVTPPTPTSFTAVLNTNGSTTLSWNPSPGPVTEYIIQRADPTDGLLGYLTSFTTIATISATNSSYTDNSGTLSVGDPLNTFGQGSVYQVEAVYAGGNSAFAGLPMLGDVISPSCAVNAKLVRGGDGRYRLAFSAVPTGVQNILIKWVLYDYWQDTWDGAFYTDTIAVSNLVNGCYVIPDDEVTNYLSWATDIFDPYDFYHAAGWDAWVQGIGANGQVGPFVEAGFVSYDAPYAMDCRQHLQDSLNFLLESATLTQQNPLITSAGLTPLNPAYAGAFPPVWLPLTNNFVQVGLYHPLSTTKEYPDDVPFVGLDNTWPLMLDYNLALWLYSTNTLPSFVWGNYGLPYLPAATWPYYLTTPVDVLLPNGTYQSGPYGIQQDMGNLADVGATVSNNGTNVSLASGIHNIFGLAVEPALPTGQPDPDREAYIDPITGFPVFWPEQPPLAPGGSITFNYGPLSSYYSQFQAPRFQTLSYYFAPVNFQGPGVVGYNSPVQRYPLPLTSDFALTNTTPFVIASVGQPMVIGGWAKQVLTNGASGVYAYLGQYFETNAYKIDTNGAVTTNTTGIVSPYGEFLPTEPGPTALKTMPDLTTGQQGTDIVNVIKMQLDVNHDGTMDLTFAGPDNTSANLPFKFWINNDDDGIGMGKDINITGLTNLADFVSGQIRSQRDLEDYARLWIMGLPPLAYYTNGYTVGLSWANVTSGNPSIKIFRAWDSDGGIGYLTNADTGSEQGTQPGYNLSLGTVSSTTVFYFPGNEFENGGNFHYLFEGAGVGQGELVLNISQNGTNIASTSVFMDLHDIKDLYERAVTSDITTGAVSNWTSRLTVQNPLPVNPTEDTNIIVLVHGINVANWDWLNDSETVYKRLYWSGFQGKFATVKWQCEFFQLWTALSLDTSVFNRSEIKAYKAGTSLKAYLTQLRTRFPGYRLNLLAHSQGNAITGEAIEQGAPFDTYILTQGAMPDSAYDVNAPTNAVLLGQEITNSPTPEWQPMGYHGVYTNLTGRIVNFFNASDPVLAVWQVDQGAGKPDGYLKFLLLQESVPTAHYSYDGTNGWYNTALGPGSYLVTDPQESRAFISRSRTLSIGQSGPASGHGIIQSAVDLNARFGFYNAFPDDHSAQWTWPIQTTRPYFQQVLTSCQIEPAP